MLRPRVLFLCTGNSCRSQMAEGFARALHGDAYEVHSAGVVAHGTNPHAVAAMRRLGVDISGQESKSLDALDDLEFDLVVTVCDHAHERLPALAGDPHVVHQPFPDPPARARGLDGADLDACYTEVATSIRDWLADGLPTRD